MFSCYCIVISAKLMGPYLKNATEKISENVHGLNHGPWKYGPIGTFNAPSKAAEIWHLQLVQWCNLSCLVTVRCPGNKPLVKHSTHPHGQLRYNAPNRFMNAIAQVYIVICQMYRFVTSKWYHKNIWIFSDSKASNGTFNEPSRTAEILHLQLATSAMAYSYIVTYCLIYNDIHNILFVFFIIMDKHTGYKHPVKLSTHPRRQHGTVTNNAMTHSV